LQTENHRAFNLNWRKHAIAQACAFRSPFSALMSEIEIINSHYWTWVGSSLSSKTGCTVNRSRWSLFSSFSAHSGVGGALIGGTPSSGVPRFPCRASSTHLIIP
jgi:hypothetical protein